MSTLQLEEGKCYRSRDGRKFGPVRHRGRGLEFNFPWDIDEETDESWADSGAMWDGAESDGDLIAEWTDDPTDEVLYASPPLLSAPALPDDNPKTVFGVAKPGVHAIPPSALLYLGQAMEDGRKKYGLMNWRTDRVSASTYYNAMAARHLPAFWDGEDVAADSKIHHLAHVMACCAILIDAIETGQLNDDRPVKGNLPDLIVRLTKKLGA